jgi:hypothetical protein
MYDKGKIITGVVIALVLVTFPLSYLAASGDGGYVPQPVLPTDEAECVEPTQWMIDNHMHLLDEWRNTVVRGDDRVYVASDGTEYTISLTGTCLGCHTDKDEFCDACHNFAGVQPTCWNCHVTGEEEAD